MLANLPAGLKRPVDVLSGGSREANPVTSSKKEKTSQKGVFSFCKPITVCETAKVAVYYANAP